MGTYGLVHGAWHDASCWELLTLELEQRGHRVIAVDLPCDDPSATFSTYADVVVAALEGQEDIVLVGHSLAGLTIPIAAATLPVRRIVFLCALIASPRHSLVDQFEKNPEMLFPDYQAGLSDADGSLRHWIDFEVAREILYGDCDEQTANAAFERLRPQALTPYVEPCPLDELPRVERAYILCSDDRLVNPEWARRAASDRLGVEPVELPGSHSPFLSRPADLAHLLDTYS